MIMMCTIGCVHRAGLYAGWGMEFCLLVTATDLPAGLPAGRQAGRQAKS